MDLAVPVVGHSLKTFASHAELLACVGQEVVVSDWTQVTQPQVQLFADATGDQQWIHVDPERAETGPFGATIAHGFLTLALIPRWMEASLQIAEARMSINYGLNKLRFPAPVPVGSRLRARFKLASADALDESSVQLQWDVTVEREGHAKPVCVAELLVRSYT